MGDFPDINRGVMFQQPVPLPILKRVPGIAPVGPAVPKVPLFNRHPQELPSIPAIPVPRGPLN